MTWERRFFWAGVALLLAGFFAVAAGLSWAYWPAMVGAIVASAAEAWARRGAR